ncbi:WG repeat-containing protein [Sphingobacterium corticibacterium]|nr:WG repeat-containing protein [Sphingobacterium corticibacterium]
MKKIILFLVLALGLNLALGQRMHDQTVYFNNVDGFSGYVKFTTTYEGGADMTRLKAIRGSVITLTAYSNVSNEELEELSKNGIDLRLGGKNHVPDKGQIAVTGSARLITDWPTQASLSLNQHGTGDFTSVPFSEIARKQMKEWRKAHSESKESQWEKYGVYRDISVTELLLPDLKNEINRILGDYKRQQEGFANAVVNSIQQANVFSFDAAESYLNNAKSFSNNSNEQRSKISELEKLIAEKKKEQAEAEKEKQELAQKEAEEKEKEAEEKKTAQTSVSSSSSSEKSEDEDEDEKESKSTTKRYIPKTATQMHSELKAMAAQNPGMMNDPNFRQRLRHLEVDANREQQTLRDYRSGVHNANRQTLAQYAASNQRIDTYTKATGDVTDAVAGMVTGLLAERDRKNEQRRLQIQADINNYNAKRDALRSYHDEMTSERTTYTNGIEQDLEAKYDEVWKIMLSPLMYDTEIEDDNSSNVHAFKKAKLTYGFLNAYVIGHKGEYGLAADNGTVIYPPQFESIKSYDYDKENVRFIVNIYDKWGELDANGRIVEEVKYDGLWYTVDGQKIALMDNQWVITDKSGQVNKYPKNDLKGKQVLLSNLNDKGFNYTNNFYSYLYVLDFEKGIYSSHIQSRGKNLTKLTTYGLNTKESEYINGVYKNHYAYLFKKDNDWYKAEIHRYTTNTYTLTKMPNIFVIAVNNRYIEENTGPAQWGAINQNNEVIIPFEHKQLNDFVNGRALSEKGIYNESGSLIVSDKYSYLSDFDQGHALFHDKKSTGGIGYGLIDDEGNEVVRLSENRLSSAPKSIWYNLGSELSKESNPNKNLELAIYCYGKDDNPNSSGMSYYNAGKIYYHEAGKNYYPQALDYFLKASKSVIWNSIGNNTQHEPQGRFSIKMSELYNLRYIGFMYYRGQGTAESQTYANEYFEKLIRKGEQIIKDFSKKGSTVDVSSVYYPIGEAYEHLGNKKQAIKYYKRSKSSSANDRLQAIEDGRMYSF